MATSSASTPPAGSTLPDPLPLFPLQTVLFPGGQLVLKVFEARYLDLMAECRRNGQPFGVVALEQGREVGAQAGVRLESVGTVAQLDEMDAEEPGILRVRCTGGVRFKRVGDAWQRPGGLWMCKAEALADDPKRLPGPAMLQTVQALATAIKSLREQGQTPFYEPYRLDDAGWVANRWCELLPIPNPAKQQLMALSDPVIRLSLVDAFLRDKKVVIG
ncbi:MAG: LON peptidase substrate-binding domain-containing protein [Rubrivivax sp.]